MEGQHALDHQPGADLQRQLALLRAGRGCEIHRLFQIRLGAAVGAEAHFQPILQRITHQRRSQTDALLDLLLCALVCTVPLVFIGDNVEQHQQTAGRREIVLFDLQLPRSGIGAPVNIADGIARLVLADAVIEKQIRPDEPTDKRLALPAR